MVESGWRREVGDATLIYFIATKVAKTSKHHSFNSIDWFPSRQRKVHPSRPLQSLLSSVFSPEFGAADSLAYDFNSITTTTTSTHLHFNGYIHRIVNMEKICPGRWSFTILQIRLWKQVWEKIPIKGIMQYNPTMNKPKFWWNCWNAWYLLVWNVSIWWGFEGLLTLFSR